MSVFLLTLLTGVSQWSYAEGSHSTPAPAHPSSCRNGDHLLDQAVFDSFEELEDYLTPNTMVRIGRYAPSFPRHLPLLRIVRHCPDLLDDAVRRLAAKTDNHFSAFRAIILANLLPGSEEAVREVVHAIPPAIKRSNVLLDAADGCAADGHFGPCDKMDAAIRAENGGHIPDYPRE